MRRFQKYEINAEIYVFIMLFYIFYDIWSILTEKTPFEPGKKATPLKNS